MTNYELNWSDLAFGGKKPLRSLKAIFIAPPREMSVARFAQIVKAYLPSGNIVVGCATEEYINGFEGQSQFKTLRPDVITDLINKVNNSASPHKITLLHCCQSDLVSIYEKVNFKRVLLINGSWQYSFHVRPEYYALMAQNIPIEYLSPYASEEEARRYAISLTKPALNIKSIGLLNDHQMMEMANLAAASSFDCAFQTGVALGQKRGYNYKLMMTAYNKTVPYSTFAWHFGPLRERHMSQPGDLNYYDTVHAEVMLMVQAGKAEMNLTGMSLFINLLPCPTCARMLCETDVAEIVYSLDHSDGYAVKLLEKAGKTVRRLVVTKDIQETEG